MKKTLRIEHFGKVYSIRKVKFIIWLGAQLDKQAKKPDTEKFDYELNAEFTETKLKCADSSLPAHKNRITTERLKLLGSDMEYVRDLWKNYLTDLT